MASNKKKCTKCEVTKSITEFSPNGTGTRAQCKECRRAANKASKASGVGTNGVPTPKANPKKNKKSGDPRVDKGTHNANNSNINESTNLRDSLNEILNPEIVNPDSLLPPLRQRGNGWNPGLKMEHSKDGVEEGTVTTGAMPVDGRDVTWDEVLLRWGLDPEVYEVVEPVYFNVWDAQSPNGPKQMRQAKGHVVKRHTEDGTVGVDVDGLVQTIKKTKPKKLKPVEGEGAFLVSLSDLQLGKGEGGGSPAIVGRFLHMLDAVEERIKELRKIGRPIHELVIFLPGDTVENCSGFYSMQTFQADLDNRQQARVARELITKAILRWSPFFSRTRVVAVAGNHGERRLGGKAYTTFADNADLEAVETVGEAFRLAGRDDVEFILGYGDDPLTAIVDIAGWSWGMIHGHVTRGGSGAEAKVYNWYKSMSAQKQPIGFVDCLITGHFHHYRAADLGGLWFMQSPSIDGGSEWFSSTGGGWSDPGMLTAAVYPEHRCTDVQILACPPHLRATPERISVR